MEFRDTEHLGVKLLHGINGRALFISDKRIAALSKKLKK
jgi:hypothetical protein